MLAATIVQNKAVAEQGLEAGEEEENRGDGEVQDMELSWMKECFTALGRHADKPAVQVYQTFSSWVFYFVHLKTLAYVKSLVLRQEAACWAIHSLLLHGAGLNHVEEEQDERYMVMQWSFTRTFKTVWEPNVKMLLGYLLHRTPVHLQLMAVILAHSSSPSLFEAATSAMAALITHNSESSAAEIHTWCAEVQLWWNILTFYIFQQLCT